MWADVSGLFTSVGGPVVIALLAISMLAAAITIVKIVQFRAARVGRHVAIQAALSAWENGDRHGAIDRARRTGGALGEVVGRAMNALMEQPNNAPRARDLALRTALDNLADLGTHLRTLETIVQAAPMLGLLGTVFGMIDAFSELARSGGTVDPTQLAGGIWVALITTALGLTIAIPFYFASTWLDSRLERERSAMDAAITGVLAGAARGAYSPT